MPPSVTDPTAVAVPFSAVPFSAVPGGVRVRVRLAPRSAANRVTGIHADADGGAVLKVAVTAAPEAGKANAQLIKLLAREWRLAKSALTITAGATDRRKVLTIDGATDPLMERLAAWTAHQDWTKGETDP